MTGQPTAQEQSSQEQPKEKRAREAAIPADAGTVVGEAGQMETGEEADPDKSREISQTSPEFRQATSPVKTEDDAENDEDKLPVRRAASTLKPRGGEPDETQRPPSPLETPEPVT